MRRLTERIVYSFLGWFESFDSVWQTTLLCIGGTVFEDALPRLDPGHLVFLLILSLYATYTQNALAHVNKLTADKVTAGQEDNAATLALLVQLAQNDETTFSALAGLADELGSVLPVVAALLEAQTKEAA